MSLYIVLCLDEGAGKRRERKRGGGGEISVRFLDTRERSREAVCIYHYTV